MSEKHHEPNPNRTDDPLRTCLEQLQPLEELIKARRVLRPRAPEAEAPHEAEILLVAHGRRRAVHHAGAGETVLEVDDGDRRFGRLDLLVHAVAGRFGVAVGIELDRLGLWGGKRNHRLYR